MYGSKTLILGLSIACSTILQANPLEQEGEAIAKQGNGKGLTPCAPCHGDQGEGKLVEAFPQLAGLSPDYMKTQLVNFRSGARENPVMQAVAQMLSEPEEGKVIAYFSSLPSKKIPDSNSSISTDVGQAIATTGLWNKAVPACFACHGPDGMGVGTAFPRIAWQPPLYIVAQLKAWQKNTRKNDPNGLMKVVADKLTDDEIQSVANYLNTIEARK